MASALSKTRRVAAAALACIALVATAAHAAAPSLTCTTGPVEKTYGQTQWYVYSCADGKSVVVVAAPGNPATPFYFIWLADRSGAYHLSGEGTGARKYTSPAYAQLRTMTSEQIADLITQTRRGTSATPVK